MAWRPACLAIGAAVGFLAGLFGIGGGALIVPRLVWAYAAQGLPAEHILRMALGTSMATMFFTSLASTRAHHRHGSVDWYIVRAMSPGILRLEAQEHARTARTGRYLCRGAFLSVPFLAWCAVPLRRAIGTAAATGFPIAIAGTAGYVIQGLRTDVSGASLPAGSFGYVYLPALVFIVLASMATAPLGARTAYRLPLKRLRMLFGLMMCALALRTLASLW